MSMIVPLSLAATDDFLSCRAFLQDRFGTSWSSTFGKRPSALFSGVQIRCTIFLGAKGDQGHHATNHQLWRSERRASLFEKIRYASIPVSMARQRWHKLGNPMLVQLVETLMEERPLRDFTDRHGEYQMSWKGVATYWMPVSFEPAPIFSKSGETLPDPDKNLLKFREIAERDRAVASLAGKIGYLWWSANGDDFHVPKWIVETFPLAIDASTKEYSKLMKLANELKAVLGNDLLWNLNAGKWVGNYDLRLHSSITDRVDDLILQALDSQDAREALMTWYHQVMQATGEATGAHRGPIPPLGPA